MHGSPNTPHDLEKQTRVLARCRGGEFVEEVRHYCRNPRCRSKLPAPFTNPRQAFCSRGCYNSFYLHRCRVCEGPIEQPKAGGERIICKKAKCRRAWQVNAGFGRYHAPSAAKPSREVPDFIGSKPALNPGRAWRIVAGELTPSQLHCATVPDGPRCHGGEVERTEAKNRRLIEQHFAQLDAVATDQCSACGIDHDLVDHKHDPNRPERTVTLCRACRDKGHRDHAGAAVPADLSIPEFMSDIPDFLQRNGATS